MRNTLTVAAVATVAIVTTSAVASERAEPPRPRTMGQRFEEEATGPERVRYLVGAAGDIACEAGPNGPSEPTRCQFDDTADLIVGTGLDEVLLLGDTQYDQGAYRAYLNYFDPTWGRALGNLSPAPGNHEYANDPSSTPGGYFRYFGDRARGPDGLGYYSFDLGACPDEPCWHVISLNSELCFAPGGCGSAKDPTSPGPGNLMHAWLEQDLADHPDAAYPCTLAYWHHPRFSFSTGSGASTAVRPLWRLLYRANADIVLNGHSHNFQRWRPQDPGGERDERLGIRQFIVGTGGASHYAIAGGTRPGNLVKAQADAFGMLRLALRADSYRWKWVSAAGQPDFDDASAHPVPCVRTPAT